MEAIEIYTPIYNSEDPTIFEGWCLSRLSGLKDDSEAWDSTNYILTIPEIHTEKLTDAEGNPITDAEGNTQLEGQVICITSVGEDGNEDDIRSEIKELKIPSSVQSIHDPVFANAKNIEKVCFAGTQTQWCQIAFSEALSNPLIHGAKLFLNSTITKTKTRRRKTAQARTAEVEEYVTSLTFEATQEEPVYIFPYAFRSYKWLQDLTIILDDPASIKIGIEAFEDCEALQVVKCSQGLAAWNDIEVYKQMTKTSAGQITCEAGDLQSTLAAIPLNNKTLQLAWGGDTYEELSSVEIARDTIKTVCLGGNNHPLETLTKSLKTGLFAYCNSIKQLIIAESYANSSLNNLVTGCPSLESITVAPTNSEYTIWNNVLYSKDFSQLIQAPANLRAPSAYKGQQTDFVRSFTCHPNTKEILAGACRGTKFYTVHLFGSVESIYEDAFADAIFLKEIRLGDSIKSIGERAFANCYSVETLALGNGLEEIASKAFENCIMLKMLRLPRNLQAIYSQAFTGCTNLETIKYSTTGTQFFKYVDAFDPVDLADLKTFITTGNSTMGEALYGLYGNQFGVAVNITNEEDKGDE